MDWQLIISFDLYNNAWSRKSGYIISPLEIKNSDFKRLKEHLRVHSYQIAEIVI